MARARSFTDEQIIQAAAKLQSEGKNVNKTNLRLEVGVGRPSALFSAYEDLINKGAIKAEPSVGEVVEIAPEMESKPLPTEIQEAMSSGIAEIERMIRFCNDKAHDMNERRVADEIKKARLSAEAAEAKAKEFSDQLDTQLEILSSVEEHRDELEEQLHDANSELSSTKADLSAMRSECERLAKENKTLDTENTKNSKLVTGLTAQLDFTKGDLSKCEDSLQVITEAKTETDKQLARTEQQLEDVKKQHASVSASLDAANAIAAGQTDKINELTAQVATLTAENKQISGLQKQIDDLTAALKVKSAEQQSVQVK